MRAEHKHLLNDVADAIKRNPTRFDAENDCEWGIEGWVLRVAGVKLNVLTDEYNEAAKLLGLVRSRASLLFDVQRWPPQFRARFEEEPSSPAEFRQNARLAAARIKHFVEVGA